MAKNIYGHFHLHPAKSTVDTEATKMRKMTSWMAYLFIDLLFFKILKS